MLLNVNVWVSVLARILLSVGTQVSDRSVSIYSVRIASVILVGLLSVKLDSFIVCLLC